MPQANELEHVKHATAAVAVEQLLLQRWSPRAFADKPVSDADLKSIFTAAGWAASSYNEQPWRFIVGRKGDAVWQKIFDCLMPLNQGWAAAAPILYVSFAKKTFSHNNAPNGVYVHDVGAASANASLEATALGLHTHGMAGFDRDKIRAAFNVPEEFDPVACWAIGYLGDPGLLPDALKNMELQARQRKPLSEIVFGNWGEPAL